MNWKNNLDILLEKNLLDLEKSNEQAKKDIRTDYYIHIEEIEVKGNIRLSENDILRISRLKVGSSIDMEDIQNAVKNLSKLNQFNDIQIFLKDQNSLSDGVNLKIIVDEHPLLRKLEIRGNKKLKDNKIIELMELSEGTLLSKIKIFSAKKKYN